VPQTIDWIVQTYPEYSVLSLHTLAEPSCGIALLQRTTRLYQPQAAPAKARREHAVFH
jgi:hypothetical protein